MKIVLIFPPRRNDSYVFPPTSLLYISKAARVAGHQAKIVDVPYLIEKYPDKFSLLDDSIYDHVAGLAPDMIGLGGVVSAYFYYEEFVRQMRRRLGETIPFIAGGSVAYPIKDVWAANAPLEYLAEGDGERLIVRLLDLLAAGDREGAKIIPGVYHLRDGKYQGVPAERGGDIDEIGSLDYDEIDVEFYIDHLSRWLEDIIPDRGLISAKKLRILPLITSRGCPFTCTFCFHFNRSHRYHSVEFVLTYLKTLKEKYKINGLYVIDDLLNCNQKHAIALFDSITKADLGLFFIAGGGKPSLVSPELMASMKRAGVVRFSFGIESGSQKMLDLMDKKTTVEENVLALRLAEKTGVPAYSNIIFGMPGEDASTLAQTREMLIRAGLDSSRYYASWATAYPGTPLFAWMQEQGMVEDVREYLFEVGSIGRYLHNFSDLPRRELEKRVRMIPREVDCAHHLAQGRYLSYLQARLGLVVERVTQRLHPRERASVQKMIGRVRRMALCPEPKGMKRTKMRCSEEAERFCAMHAPQIKTRRP